MLNPVIEKLGMDAKTAFELSEEIGQSGTWLHLCEPEEDCWTDEVYRLFGIERGRKINMEYFYSLVYPDDRERVRAEFEQAMESGEYFTSFRMVVRGEIRWMEDRGRLLRDRERGCRFLVGMVRDITRLKEQQLDVELHKREYKLLSRYFARAADNRDIRGIVEEVYRMLSELMDVALTGILLELDGGAYRFFSHNGLPGMRLSVETGLGAPLAFQALADGAPHACEVKDYPDPKRRAQLELIGARGLLCMPVHYCGENFAVLVVALAGGCPTEREGTFCRTICEFLSVQLQVARLSQKLQKEFDDRARIEARNHELQKTVEMEKIKTEFFANLSHEFKTPLHIILSSMELLRMKLILLEGDRYADEYEMICKYAEQNVYRLMHLSTNLIDATRIDNGSLKLIPRRWNYQRVLTSLIESVSAYAENKRLRLHYTSKLGQKESVICDREKIERVILNLISNAIKNTPPGGAIRVSSWREPGYIVTEVSDTGEGIGPEDLPHIFEKFYVADPGPSRCKEGSGMGLSITKSLVEMHGGTVSASSKLGKGTSIRFTISDRLRAADLVKPQAEGANGSTVQMELSEIL